MAEYTDGYVGLVCVIFSVGGLIGAAAGSILMILWQDADRDDR